MKVKIRTLPSLKFIIGLSQVAHKVVITGGVSIPFIYWKDDLNRIWIDDSNVKWRL